MAELKNREQVLSGAIWALAQACRLRDALLQSTQVVGGTLYRLRGWHDTSMVTIAVLVCFTKSDAALDMPQATGHPKYPPGPMSHGPCGWMKWM